MTTSSEATRPRWRRNEFESGAPVRRESVGTDPAQRKFCVVSLHFFGCKRTISRFTERFVMVSTVWSVSCLLFCSSRCPRALWSRRQCSSLPKILLAARWYRD